MKLPALSKAGKLLTPFIILLSVFILAVPVPMQGQPKNDYVVIGKDTVPISNLVRIYRDTIREEFYDEDYRYMFRTIIITRATYLVGSRVRGTSNSRFYAESMKNFNPDAIKIHKVQEEFNPLKCPAHIHYYGRNASTDKKNSRETP